MKILRPDDHRPVEPVPGQQMLFDVETAEQHRDRVVDSIVTSLGPCQQPHDLALYCTAHEGYWFPPTQPYCASVRRAAMEAIYELGYQELGLSGDTPRRGRRR